MFAMRDMLKDLDLGLSLYSGSTVPLTSLTRELFAKAESQAAVEDISAIVRAYSPSPPPERQNEASSPR